MLPQIETALHLFHFGLVVLIWMVQLVIYPSFKYTDPGQFADWHRIYTERVSLVVVPLMLGQLGLSLARPVVEYLQSGAITLPSLLVLLLVLGCWAATFLISVPIHAELQERGRVQSVVEQLVLTNWIRTGLWSAVCLLDFFY
ncbi:MAG: hypothetical protein NXI24_19265 [bacterium]|nr:hypothetical protein [bacterium]